MPPKLSRNAPCPCGSGNKYKKCCLSADQARESEARREQAKAAQQVASAAATLSRSDPSKVVQAAERPEQGPQARVAGLTTKQLCERLEQHGIETTPEAFRELARGRDSAWSIGEDLWLPALSAEPDEDAQQFICLAACELWRRWDDGSDPHTRRLWLADGYRYTRDNKASEACDHWLRLWLWMAPQLNPLMRDVADADLLLGGGEEPMADWLLNLGQELRSAALEQADYVEPGIRFCEQVLGQFVDAEQDYLDNLRGDLADLLVLTGERGKAEAILEAIVEARPAKSIGYVRLAEALTLRSKERGDLDRAISLLEAALAVPVVDPDDWDLEIRLDRLRETRAAS